MYRAPVREVRFVLEEAARFAETVLEPLNQPGDVHGARWTENGVVTAPGFREAYRQFVEGGWPALGAFPEFGGQRTPRVLNSAVSEFWASANLAFKLGPMLTHGAVHALELTGSRVFGSGVLYLVYRPAGARPREEASDVAAELGTPSLA